jgi:O-antigen ligase
MAIGAAEDHGEAGQARDGLIASVRGLAAGALALMPLAMWLASRSAPFMLTVSAGACLMMLAREAAMTHGRSGAPPAGWRGRWSGFSAPARHGLACLAAFLAFAFASAFWSHDLAASLRSYGELALSVGAGAIVAAILPGRAPRWAGWALLASLSLACVLTLLELSGLNVWRAGAGLRAHTFIFNRTLILCLLLALPLAAWAAAQRRYGLAALPLALLAAAILASESGAAKLGLAVAGAAALIASAAPRLSLLAGAAGLVALLAFAPVQGEIADRVIPAKVHRQLQESHSRDRVDIWQTFGEAIRARPLFGSGIGATATLQNNPVAAAVSPDHRTMLAVGHPHSTQVQIWAETGLAGAALLLLAGLNLIAVIGLMRRPWRIAAFATFAGAAAIAAVGHGAWQGWWIAALGASLAWFRLFQADLSQRPASHDAIQREVQSERRHA